MSPWHTYEAGLSPGWTLAVMNTILAREEGSRLRGWVIVRRSSGRCCCVESVCVGSVSCVAVRSVCVGSVSCVAVRSVCVCGECKLCGCVESVCVCVGSVSCVAVRSVCVGSVSCVAVRRVCVCGKCKQ